MAEPSDLLAATRLERVELCDYFETLAADQWTQPSLCAGWSIHAVLAHLTTSTRTGMREFMGGMLRHRGDFDRMEEQRAVNLVARHSPAVLIDQLRQTAGSPRRAPFTTPIDPLVDILVHGQDVARPLGHDRPLPLAAAVPASDHVVHSRWYGSRKRLSGLRLEAEDADWSHGAGHVVSGSVADLLLAATGRPAGLDALSGPGLDTLSRRLDPPPG